MLASISSVYSKKNSDVFNYTEQIPNNRVGSVKWRVEGSYTLFGICTELASRLSSFD